MAFFTLENLFTVSTVEPIKTTIYGWMAAAGLPVTAWQKLSPTRTLTDAQARLYNALQKVVVDLAKSSFLSTAGGQWLVQLALDQFGVAAITEDFAVGEFVAVNSGGGEYDYAPGEITFSKIGTILTYHNVDAVHIVIGPSSLAIPIVADTPGSSSSAAPGDLEWVNPPTGVSGTNQLALAGQDDEEPGALKDRCVLARGPLSPMGPRAAYEYVARTPELNGGVNVTRTRLLPPPGNGTVTVVVASALGAIDPTDLQKIQDGVDKWAVPATVLATVVSAGEAPQTISARVYVPLYNGPNLVELAAAVKASLIKYVDSLPIGGVQLVPGVGVVPWSGLVYAIKNTPLGLDAEENTIRPVLAVTLLGAGEVDTPLALTEVATLVAGSITLEFAAVSS